VNGDSRATPLRKESTSHRWERLPEWLRKRFLEYTSGWGNIPRLRRALSSRNPYIGGGRVIETTFEQGDSLKERS